MVGLNIFVHQVGSTRLTEVVVEPSAIGLDVLRHPELSVAVEAIGDEILIFIDEQDAPVGHHEKLEDHGAVAGGRLHLVHCHQVEVRVYYMHLEACRPFPPGIHLKRVKEWAVREFGLAQGDAVEHVLQIHGTTDRPNSATPLSTLLKGHGCAIAFDLVPDKRVEG